MGRPTTTKKKIHQISGSKSNDGTRKHANTKAAFDEDTTIFIKLSQELKAEGKRLFQRHDHEGALLKYEKAIKLLPSNHIDVASLRTNMAACYMHMGIGEYPKAVNECNLALLVAPKYSKALIRRARCYQALNSLQLALADANHVLAMEPNNLTALEISNHVKEAIEKTGGVQIEDKQMYLPPNDHLHKLVVKGKRKKRRGHRKSIEEEPKGKIVEEKKAVVAEKRSVKEEKVVLKSVKLVHGEDIRWAQIPVNCGVRLVRDIVIDRYPSLKGVLIKYKDQEGDLVTITTTDELRVAMGLADHQGFLRLYITEVGPGKEPLYDGVSLEGVSCKGDEKPLMMPATCVEDWTVQFAKMFKNHVGIDTDSYLDIHELGMKLYSEAVEEAVSSEDAQQLFDLSGAKFQEMAALAMFNWGNVHMSKARKRPFVTEDGSSTEPTLEKVKSAYDWAQNEYVNAGRRYEKSLKVKPDFYEGLLALSLQQFEQAKLSWYYVVGSQFGLEIGPSGQVLELYNKAEDSMEKGMQMWEEMEEQRLNGLSKHEKEKEETSEQAEYMKSQIYLFWGTMLYERSVVEYKLSLQTWEECLEIAIERFELGGASSTDIAVMIKNHCSNETALEGFKVDEIVQALNEMYDADRWRSGAASFRLEPLFRRHTPKLHTVLEQL